MNYYRFFVSNSRILIFAIILTFFSGFGQTFLLSLYIPEIIKEFDISQGAYSRIYAIATLCSGITIIFAGKFIDRIPLQRFTLLVITGIIAANLLAGISINLYMLFVAIFMLRFFGQGMLTHTSMTAMGRYFSKARGKALSIAYLGFPMAEAVFPISVVSVIMLLGWRESFLLSAAVILVVLLPLVFFLLKNFNKSKIREEGILAPQAKASPEQDRYWSQRDIIRKADFYTFAPTAFITGFTLTALFFFQTFIAEFKGWTIEWMALNIGAYAVSSLVFSIAAGPLTDRFTARKIFPFVLVPMALGIATLALHSHPATTTIFWFLVGMSAGANPTVSNALYAETFGVKSLGSIRSIFTFVMVISTAAGPVVYSSILESNFNFNQIHLILSGVILLNIVFVFLRSRSNTSRLAS